MTANERRSAFGKERTKQLKKYGVLTAEIKAKVIAILEAAQAKIAAALAASPTVAGQIQLTAARAEVIRTLEIVRSVTDAELQLGAVKVWELGIAMVEAPLAAAGVAMPAVLIDLQQIVASTQQFLTRKIADITDVVRKQIDAQLTFVLTGASGQSDAINAIAAHLGGSRDRALTIARTELGRVYSAATQARLEQAVELEIPMQKQWRRSGKRHARASHNQADGQVRDVDKKFDIGGESLRYPRDPKASAANTINCGCVMLPHVATWAMLNPERQPLSAQEQTWRAAAQNK